MHTCKSSIFNLFGYMTEGILYSRQSGARPNDLFQLGSYVFAPYFHSETEPVIQSSEVHIANPL